MRKAILTVTTDDRRRRGNPLGDVGGGPVDNGEGGGDGDPLGDSGGGPLSKGGFDAPGDGGGQYCGDGKVRSGGAGWPTAGQAAAAPAAAAPRRRQEGWACPTTPAPLCEAQHAASRACCEQWI